jgi:circadian clock protein KaiC
MSGQTATTIPQSLEKTLTGIRGLDEITFGGLPRGRPTLVCGGAGSGKTLLGLEFLARGAVQFDEPGVFLAFEETARELTTNIASLGFDLDTLVSQKKLYLDHVKVDPTEIIEAGDFDLEGLFIRLGREIDLIGAKRVVLDTLETLFGELPNPGILRAELHRLFRWLKEKEVTVILTGERGDGTLTRHGMEEYVSDCVISLDHRVSDEVSTRRLRIVKYRGSVHGTNEYPFLIDEQGISVLPITSLGLDHEVSSERITSGIPRLDTMLGGEGFFRGSSVLLSGTAGTGKTSTAATFADATCRGGERCLYLAFEESQSQIIRNMRSIGLDLEPWVKAGLLRFHSSRPASTGLEMHLAMIHKQVTEFQPRNVIVDPISSFVHGGVQGDAAAMILRLVDFMKSQQITALFTNLVIGGGSQESPDLKISSLIDTWLLLRDIELGGERNRGLYILKSRGMAHSNQIREFRLTSHGIDLVDVYLGPEGVLTGSMRQAQEAREKAAGRILHDEIDRKKHLLDRKRRVLDSQINALQLDLESEEEGLKASIAEAEFRQSSLAFDRTSMSASRGADSRNGNGELKRGQS